MNCARVYVTAGGSAFGETKNNGPGHIPVSVLPLYEERRGAILEFPACILLSEDDPTPTPKSTYERHDNDNDLCQHDPMSASKREQRGAR